MKKPKIRFNGFIDDWQKRRLGEVILSERKGKAKASMIGSKIKYLETGYLNGGTGTFVNAPKDVEKEDVLILWDGSQAGTVYYGFEGALGSTLKAYKPKFSGGFLYQYLKFNQKLIFEKYRTPNIPHVMKTFTDEFYIWQPSLTEQEENSKLFETLDHLITLHQQKCEQIKTLKKYMLQNMFPQNGEKTPKIRFDGFTKDWEQRKLGTLVEIGDIDHRMPPTVEKGIPYLMTGDFCGVNELDFSNAKLISEDDYIQLSKKIKPEKGDIIFARYASVGAVRYIDFTRDFLISYSCAIIKSGKKITPKYLYHYLTSNDAQKQIQLEINTGSQANIGIDSMKNSITVAMPRVDEQLLISNFLTSLDNLITLHKQKCEELQKMKKFMLQNMFI